MNKDQVKGRVEQVKGVVKEVAGKATGNKSLEVKGKLDKLSGQIQSGHGDAKQKVADIVHKA